MIDDIHREWREHYDNELKKKAESSDGFKEVADQDIDNNGANSNEANSNSINAEPSQHGMDVQKPHDSLATMTTLLQVVDQQAIVSSFKAEGNHKVPSHGDVKKKSRWWI